MKANVKKGKPGERPCRSGAVGAAYINALKKKALDEFDQTRGDYVMSVEETIFWTLHEEFGFGAERLRRLFEETVRMRVSAIDGARPDGYELQATAENPEDFAIRAALKSIGVDIAAWEDGIDYRLDENGRRVVSFRRDA